LTDTELIRQAREKNSEAWNTLSRRYLPLVWRYAYALLRDTHSAEDIVGEVMLALLKGINQIDPETPKISAWLRSVVRHKIADHHRRVYRAKDHLPRIGQQQQDREEPLDPSAPLLVSENKTQIVNILDTLPERQRIALEWKYVEGLRVREIAQRLGETEKTVEATLYRARREFKRVYELAENEQTTISNSPMSNPAPKFPWSSTTADVSKD